MNQAHNAQRTTVGQPISRISWSICYLRLAGCILVIAAILKLHQHVTAPEPGQWPLTALLVSLEVMLGTWYISAVHPRQAWWTAVGLFGCFALYNLTQGLAGTTSCGCFGVIEVNPWASLVFDLGVLSLLAAFPVPLSAASVMVNSKRVLLIGTAGLALLFTCLAIIVATRPVAPPLTLADSGANAAYLLEPVDWIGDLLPIARYIDNGEELLQGEWMVLLYRHGCASCRSYLERIESGAADCSGWVIVEIPPYDPMFVRPSSSSLRYARLSDAYRWAVTTPSVIRVSDGLVVEAEAPSGLAYHGR